MKKYLHIDMQEKMLTKNFIFAFLLLFCSGLHSHVLYSCYCYFGSTAIILFRRDEKKGLR